MFTVGFLVSLLIAALVVVVVIFVVKMILEMLPLPPQAKTIAYIIVGLIFLLWLLQALGFYHF